MPSRFLFPRIRRFHPHEATNEGDIPSSNSSDTSDTTPSTASTTESAETRRTRRTRNHEHRRHSRHHHHHSSSAPSTSCPEPMRPSHPAIQNFRLRWIDQEHEECAVCTKQFEVNCVVTLLPCGHYFCQSCMDQWFWKIQSSTCPLCRYDILAEHPCDDDEEEFDELEIDSEYYPYQHHNATTATDNHSTDYLSLVTKVVLTGDMSEAKCEKLTDSLSWDGVNPAFGTNFDLIMAKALHARRARMAYEMNSSLMDSFILDNQD